LNKGYSKKKSFAVRLLRRFRQYHKIIGLVLSFFIIVSCVTGFLLSWKKDFDIIQPSTKKGESKNIEDWKDLSDIATLAQQALYEYKPQQNGNTIDRMDVRPSKGMIKVLFENDYWEVQIDGYSGEILSIQKRNSDLIESIHDGSIVSNLFKYISMNFLSIGLLLMVVSGIWLWYGPKQIRKRKKSKQKIRY